MGPGAMLRASFSKRNAQLDARRRGLEAEVLVEELFLELGYSLDLDTVVNGGNVDLVARNDKEVIFVEVKAYVRPPNLGRLAESAARLAAISKGGEEVGKPLLAIVGYMSNAASNWVGRTNALDVWDGDELLRRSRPFPELHQKFTEFLKDAERPERAPPASSSEAEKLIRELERSYNETTSLTPSGYEDLCTRVFTFLFDPYLYDFTRQASTTDGGNRYDFICRIRPGNEFWDSIRLDFRTRAVLFECKNYGNEIGADQVYSTERYLFAGALRTVCILISPKGPDESCLRAAQGAMREAGKLILLVSNHDLQEMIRLKPESGGPESYLDQLIWRFVVSLPR
jgi:hypothetical protein